MQNPELNKKLNVMRAIAEEHFDDFLIVVIKDGDVHDTYSSRVSAMGMVKMVETDIKRSWSKWSDHRNNNEDQGQEV